MEKTKNRQWSEVQTRPCWIIWQNIKHCSTHTYQVYLQVKMSFLLHHKVPCYEFHLWRPKKFTKCEELFHVDSHNTTNLNHIWRIFLFIFTVLTFTESHHFYHSAIQSLLFLHPHTRSSKSDQSVSQSLAKVFSLCSVWISIKLSNTYVVPFILFYLFFLIAK